MCKFTQTFTILLCIYVIYVLKVPYIEAWGGLTLRSNNTYINTGHDFETRIMSRKLKCVVFSVQENLKSSRQRAVQLSTKLPEIGKWTVRDIENFTFKNCQKS